jgi:hypothetical protein
LGEGDGFPVTCPSCGGDDDHCNKFFPKSMARIDAAIAEAAQPKRKRRRRK